MPYNTLIDTQENLGIMSQRIDKIEQELAKLEGAIALMNQQLLATYSPYLKILGKAVQRQLIMAVYQLCTDVYPESFLQLSLNQRVNLQTKVKQIAQGIMTQLLTPLVDLENIISPSISSALIPTLITNVAPENFKEIEKVDKRDKREKPEKLAQVRKLVNWQRQTDTEILQLLQQCSKEVNNLLHQAKLLAQQLPIFLLEAAAKVESLNTAAVISRPNTLNLLVEMGNNSEAEVEDDSEDDPEDTPEISQILSKNIPQDILQDISQHISQHISFKEFSKEPSKEILRLTAIYLRLGDLEFNDPELGNISNNLRALITKLHALDREYHKQAKLYQIAQAQAAWRATWSED
jgi:hypothetical protein